MTADKLVAAYIKIRTKREQLKTTFEEQDSELRAKQDMISEELLEMCKSIGANSLKTTFGTASKTVKTRYWTSDWESMYDFIRQNDGFHLLEQRIHQTNIKKFLEDNPDLLPPGLNSDSRYTITIRKAR
jgi:hypothetical protein